MRRGRTRRVLGWVRDLALMLLVYLGVHAYQTREAQRGIAPEIVALDASGGLTRLSSYRGEPLLLHFWATWCGVCRAQEANVKAVAHDLPVLTVASRSGGAGEMQRYLDGRGLAAPVLLDPAGEIAARYGVSAFPTTFFLDGDGQVRHVEVGYTTELGMRLRMWLARL